MTCVMRFLFLLLTIFLLDAGGGIQQSCAQEAALVPSEASAQANASVLHLQSTLAPHELSVQQTASEEDPALSNKLGMPIYHWLPQAYRPRGVVIAIHGVAMHGRSYSGIATTLSAVGYEVYSTDLRGYGASMLTKDGGTATVSTAERIKLDYHKSSEDLVALAQHVRADRPGLPIFLLGESLGASMAIRVAALHPELADGLILSAPAVRHRSLIDSKMLWKAGLMATFPALQCSMVPFMRRYANGDPEITDELAHDPLLRRTMSGVQVVQSCAAVRPTLNLAKQISPSTPVLILQGSDDRCVKANAVVLLIDRIRSEDQTVRWFHHRGHILLETAHVKPDTMHTLCSWLDERSGALDVSTKVFGTKPKSSSLPPLEYLH